MPEYLLTVREDDEGLFIRIPVEIAEQLNARPGDRLNLSSADGGFLVASVKDDSAHDDEAFLSAYAKIREQYDGALRRLADS